MKNTPHFLKISILTIFSILLLNTFFATPYVNAKSNDVLITIPSGETMVVPESLVLEVLKNQVEIIPSELIKEKIFNKYLLSKYGEINKNFDSSYVKLADFVHTEITPKIQITESQDANWEEKDGKVVNFIPHKYGKVYDILDLADQIKKSIKNNEKNIQLEIISTNPKKNLAETNNYGIKELIATGESDFVGSSKNRFINIDVGSSRYKGLIVPPGQTFSFNEHLGPIDAEHGFTPELVIKKTGLIKEFGGGICQVSTTVFRTALRAGLPITERRNHSFAVGYYLPHGSDATIYPGVQDFKFINDTGGHIMMWPRIEGTKLYFDFYGTKDKRIVVVEDPVGYAFQSNGAFKTNLKRIITSDSGVISEDNFVSNYRPKAEFITTDTIKEPIVEQIPPATIIENEPVNQEETTL